MFKKKKNEKEKKPNNSKDQMKEKKSTPNAGIIEDEDILGEQELEVELNEEDENDPTLLAELDEVMNSGEEGEEEGKQNKRFLGF